MFISGMGFFTDAYDLFIIGVVMSLLKGEWHVSPLQEGLVTSTALLASAVGALLFGPGRRHAGAQAHLRVSRSWCWRRGAIASAFSPNIWWLIVFRIILGVGIGGDYPVSSTIMSEFAGKKTRGMMVTLVFTMQAAGLIVGPLLATGLLITPALARTSCGASCSGAGCIPALAVFQLRRHLAEDAALSSRQRPA